jgi:hypothetical protein
MTAPRVAVPIARARRACAAPPSAAAHPPFLLLLSQLLVGAVGVAVAYTTSRPRPLPPPPADPSLAALDEAAKQSTGKLWGLTKDGEGK